MLGQAGKLLNPGATFSPAALQGLALWLVGDRSPVTLNGNTISQWNDFSGNGNHAAQGTAANQPAYAPGGMNGLPAADFDNANDLLTVAAAASIENLFAGGGYMAVVCNTNDGGSFDRLFEKSGGAGLGWGVWLNAGEIVFYAQWGTTSGQWNSGGNTLTNGQPAIVEIAYDSDSAANNAIVTVDGASAISKISTPSGATPDDSGVNLSLGNLPSTFGAWNGDISEVVFCSAIPSTAEQMTLRNSLANKYGIALA